MNNWNCHQSRIQFLDGQTAIDYRREFKITPAMANGTAVNVVTMVFGNMGNDCHWCRFYQGPAQVKM